MENEKELEELMFKVNRKANSQLYKGIEPYLNLQHQMLEQIQAELSEIKMRLDNKE